LRTPKKIATGLAIVASAATLTALAAGPALADPQPAGTVPALTDIVGAGSDTIQGVLDQLSIDYNKTNPANKLYSWDATNPSTGATGDTITEKASGSSDTICKTARPNGSGAGITAIGVTNTQDAGHPCVDYARSSRGPQGSDPAGLEWVALGEDAVTWSSPGLGSGSSNPEPATLTEAQLVGIYTCQFTNWSQVGGANAPIVPVLPQTNSGTRAFFLSAINAGGAAITPGSCVVNGSITAAGNPNSPLPIEENSGVSSTDANGNLTTGNSTEFGTTASPNRNVIFPYSIADNIAQTPAPAGGGHATSSWAPGPMGLGSITDPSTGTAQAPIVTGTPNTINSNFPSDFQRTVWDVVRYTPANADGIPTNLEPIFGGSGWICSSATGQADLASYGFLSLGSSCGTFTQHT
jgi:ABC-type phosphate transport system substrate-binding protein